MIVKVYRNLKHGKKAPPLYSIQHRGKVIDRRSRVMLTNASFVVNEKGRQRVLAEKRKNVHAFVVGELVDDKGAWGQDENGKDLPAKLTYNPYVAGTFMWNQHPVKGARGVLLNERGMSACYLY
jgi:hypothetical protein